MNNNHQHSCQDLVPITKTKIKMQKKNNLYAFSTQIFQTPSIPKDKISLCGFPYKSNRIPQQPIICCHVIKSKTIIKGLLWIPHIGVIFRGAEKEFNFFIFYSQRGFEEVNVLTLLEVKMFFSSPNLWNKNPTTF